MVDLNKLKEENKDEINNRVEELMQIENLIEENQKLKAELSKERAVTDYYADKNNWQGINCLFDRIDRDDLGNDMIVCGGKLARQRKIRRE